MSGNDMTADAEETDFTAEAEDLVEQIAEDVSVDNIAGQLQQLVRMDVSLPQARNSVLRQHETKSTSTREASSLADIARDSEGNWHDVEVTVTSVYDANHDKIRQKFVVGDSSGYRTRITEFYPDDDDEALPKVSSGETYRLESLVTDVYQGDTNLIARSTTDAELLDRDIPVLRKVTGPIVSTRDKTGLVEKCSEDGCNRTLQNDGTCRSHGNVDPEDHLQIQGVVDLGDGELFTVIIPEEETTALTGITLDDALEQAREAMNRDVIRDEITDYVVGRYFNMDVRNIGSDFWISESIQEANADTSDEWVSDVLSQATGVEA